MIIHFIGGYNALWSSAASLVGNFGVTAGQLHRPRQRRQRSTTSSPTRYSPFVAPARGDDRREPRAEQPPRRAPLALGRRREQVLRPRARRGHRRHARRTRRSSPARRTSRATARETATNGVAFQRVLDMKTYLDSIGACGAGPARSRPRRHARGRRRRARRCRRTRSTRARRRCSVCARATPTRSHAEAAAGDASTSRRSRRPTASARRRSVSSVQVEDGRRRALRPHRRQRGLDLRARAGTPTATTTATRSAR